MKTIKDLKQMIAEPSSKEWFEKHGGAKSAMAKKMSSVNVAKKNLFNMGKENKGKEETISAMKKAFGKHK